MASNEEIQESLKSLFRAQELRQRQVRRQVILNHAALNDSAPDEVEAAALAIVQQQAAAFRELEQGGYWRKLWRALRGKA